MKHSKTADTFVDLLLGRLSSRPDLSDREVARRADIDASTLSVLRTRQRIKKPGIELRLRLAIALARSGEEAKLIANEFAVAEPLVDNHNWQDTLNKLRIKLLQMDIKYVELTIPHFGNMAPFMVAQKQGYFRKAGLHVFLNYARFRSPPQALIENEPDSGDTIQLAICNREAIDTSPKGIAFCFPLVARNTGALHLVVRRDKAEDGKTFSDKLRALAARAPKLKILTGTWIGSGPLERELTQHLNRFGVTAPEIGIFRLDQFDAFDAFSQGLGDAVVPTPIEWIRVRREHKDDPIFEDLGPFAMASVEGASESPASALEFHGIVCSVATLRREAAQRAIAQIIWAWYRGLDFIAEYPDEAARIVATYLNTHSESQYSMEDWQKLWDQNFFSSFRRPSQMIAMIEQSPNYVQRRFDYTNSLALILPEIEDLLTDTEREDEADSDRSLQEPR